MRKFAVALVVLLSAACANAASEAPSAPVAAAEAQAACPLQLAFTRPDSGGDETVSVYEAAPDPALGGARALFYVVASVHVNTDGTRVSYHRDDPRAERLAINNIRNALRPGRTVAEFETIVANNWLPLEETWRVLHSSVIETDARTGAPCVSADGFLVSMTADVVEPSARARMGDCDQSKWIDALTTPAIVLPSRTAGAPTQFETRGALLRSPALVMGLERPGLAVPGIVGDTGPNQEIGEATVELNRRLNALPAGDRPRTYQDAMDRFEGQRAITMVIPGAENRVGYPLTPEHVQSAVRAQFDAWGGEARLRMCVAAIQALTPQ